MQFTSRTVGLGVSVAASLAYLFAAKCVGSPADVTLKGLSVALLGLIALRERQSFLAAALLLSSLGDIVLELGRSYFLLGLAAFLTSHLIYITLFVRHRARAKAAGRQQWVFPALLAVYAIGLAVWLTPALDDMRTPVFCYIAALVAMVATASRANYRSRWVSVGAMLFLISDSLLGAGRFKLQIPWGGFVIWTTYYLGQCGITLGVLGDGRAPAVVD
jgi:uncharacterized membrane protein YhhN